MRWLAMHTKLSPNQMGVPLRDRYGAISNDTAWVEHWLAGPVSDVQPASVPANAPLKAASVNLWKSRRSRSSVDIRHLR